MDIFQRRRVILGGGGPPVTDRAVQTGANSLVHVPNNALHSFIGGVPFSISSWIKRDTASKGVAVMFKGDYFTASQTEYVFNVTNAGNEWARLYGGLVYVGRTNAGAAIGLNIWTHVCLTVDGTETEAGMRIYRNGIELGAYASISNNPTANMSAMAGGSTFGGLYSNALRTAFNPNYQGQQNDSALWNIQLSAAQVLEAWNGGVPYDLSTHSAAANIVSLYEWQDNYVDNVNAINGTPDGTVNFVNV